MRIITRSQEWELNREIQEIKDINKDLRTRNETLHTEVNELYGSILVWQEQQSQKYKGNRYTSYEQMINAANSMYTGVADWGVNQCSAIVRTRSAFILPDAVTLEKKEKGAKRELEFAKAFFEANGLDGEMLSSLVKESELEGKILLELDFDPKISKKGFESGLPISLFVSQKATPYKIGIKDRNYMRYETAVIQDGQSKRTLVEKQFVYKKFGGRLWLPNETTSAVLLCLTEIENIDKAFRDLREINSMYSAPTPHSRHDTAEQAQKTQEAVNKQNWQIGKFLAHVGELGYLQADSAGAQMIIMEIVKLAQTISMNTGIPVHFWFPDQVNNRATAEDISFGMIPTATSTERETWRSLLEELIDKAIVYYNDKLKLAPLRPGMVKVVMPAMNAEIRKQLVELWLPLRAQKIISLDTLLSKLPGVDTEEEKKKLAEEREENMKLLPFANNNNFGGQNDGENQAQTQDNEEENRGNGEDRGNQPGNRVNN